MRNASKAAATAGALLLPFAPSAAAADFTVNTAADDFNATHCTGVPGDCSLREAIAAANAAPGDDRIFLPAGRFTLTRAGAGENADATGDLDVANNGTLTITGAGARSTTIDGGGIDRVLDVQSGANLILGGVTITGGIAADTFGGSTIGGGGVLNRGTLSISDATIAGNVAENGGAGGGIGSGGPSLALTRVTLRDNKAGTDGGGLYTESTTSSLLDSTLSGNVADTSLPGTPGGSDEYSGGLEVGGGAASVVASTIAANSLNPSGRVASSRGGGVYHDSTVGTLSLENTIVAGNAPVDCNQSQTSSGGPNLDGDSSCFTASGDLHANPHLGPLQNNGGPVDTMALLDGSPALNAGAGGAACPAVDARGISRPQGPACDLGAYEATPPGALTGTATGITGAAATLNGTVNPANLATSYRFDWGTTAAYGNSTPATSAGADFASHAVGAPVGGLIAGRTYHFRLVATNAIGTSFGADQTFVAGPPQVTLGTIKKLANGARLKLTCVAGPCSGSVLLQATERIKGKKVTGLAKRAHTRKRTVTVGRASFSLASGQSRTVTVKLNPAGKKLLTRFRKLPLKVLVSLNQASGKPKIVTAAKFTLKPVKKKHGRRGH